MSIFSVFFCSSVLPISLSSSKLSSGSIDPVRMFPPHSEVLRFQTWQSAGVHSPRARIRPRFSPWSLTFPMVPTLLPPNAVCTTHIRHILSTGAILMGVAFPTVKAGITMKLSSISLFLLGGTRQEIRQSNLWTLWGLQWNSTFQ